MIEEQLEREQRVSPLELFFDLVFVFGFTQVTTVLSDTPTWRGLGHAVLLMAALWWAWASYAWLTNAVDPGEELVWGTMLAAVAAMFVAALAVPEAFTGRGVLFGVAFFIVVGMQLALYALSARGDRDLLQAVGRLVPSTLGGGALIVAAGFAHGGLKPLLWVVALGIGLFGPFFVGLSGWRVHPAHFVERHGLIVIIAIGESLVAIGVGARATGLGAGVIVAAVLGFVVAASFWLAYFDFFTLRSQQLLTHRSGAPRIALARDLSYLHLPMVAGIILFAFATKLTLAHVGDELAAVPALCLCGGPALYLFAFVAVRVRVSHSRPGGGRLVAAVAFAALIPVATVVSAVVALSLVAAVWVALHAYELIWWREARAHTRAQRAPVSVS